MYIEYVNFILSNLFEQMLPYTEIYFLNYFAHENVAYFSSGNFVTAQNGPICQDPRKYQVYLSFLEHFIFISLEMINEASLLFLMQTIDAKSKMIFCCIVWISLGYLQQPEALQQAFFSKELQTFRRV